MTIKQIDAAIAAEHGQTQLSRNYVRWLESLREWTLHRMEMQKATRPLRVAKTVSVMGQGGVA